MQVHDSIKFQIPRPPVVSWRDHMVMLQRIKKSLETPLLTHYGREFIVPCDIKMGLNMCDMVKVKGDEESLAEGYEKLRPMWDYKDMWI
jgi:hypothetical protein